MVCMTKLIEGNIVNHLLNVFEIPPMTPSSSGYGTSWTVKLAMCIIFMKASFVFLHRRKEIVLREIK